MMSKIRLTLGIAASALLMGCGANGPAANFPAGTAHPGDPAECKDASGSARATLRRLH